MKEIIIHGDRRVLLDDEDYERVKDMKWSAIFTGRRAYIVTSGLNEKGRRTTIYLHRLLMNPAPGECVDHINGDTFDNRRSNLRLATYAENARNCKVYKNNTSGFKGVRQSGNRWGVEVQFMNVKLHASGFQSAEEAAHFYDLIASRLFGEYARPNSEAA